MRFFISLRWLRLLTFVILCLYDSHSDITSCIFNNPWGIYKHSPSSHLRDMGTEAHGGKVTCSRSHGLCVSQSQGWNSSLLNPYPSFHPTSVLGVQILCEFLESSTWPFHACVLIMWPSSYNRVAAQKSLMSEWVSFPKTLVFNYGDSYI